MNKSFQLSAQEKEEVDVLEYTDIGDQSELIVLNDDYNTFDWVIQCLVEVCGHSAIQAEQLSLIIHFKGRATAKTAPFNLLRPMKDALIDRGLNAVIERVEARG